MASSLEPLQKDDGDGNATGPLVVAASNPSKTAEDLLVASEEDARTPGSQASSETAVAAPPTNPTNPTGAKRSTPTSPVRNGGEAQEDGTVAKGNEETLKRDEAEDEANTSESETPPTKRRTLCGVCHTEPSKYKCARCLLAYCSIACSRVHRDNHPARVEINPEPSSEPSPNTNKPAHPFSVLDDAPELKRLFAKYPTLPARLRSIYEATLPPKAGNSGGGGRGGSGSGNSNGWIDGSDPRISGRAPFQNTNSGGRGRGGRGGGGRGRGSSSVSSSPKPWTQEIGLRQGQKALRRARVDPGEDGDGVREYCETVTYLLARGEVGGGVGGQNDDRSPRHDKNEVVALVRQELAHEDTQLIERLLDMEGRR